jgi:PAS domain S-box-containing protein
MSDASTKAELERLQLVESRLRSITEHAPDFIIQLDIDGRITYLNRPAPGHTIEEMIGTDVRKWMAPEYHAEFDRTVAAVFETGNVSSYESVGSITGRYYVNRVSPVIAGGNVCSAVLITHDVTELKEAEQALRDSDQRYRDLARASFEGFAEVMSSVAIARAGADDRDRLASCLEQIESAASRARDLTNQLLAIAGHSDHVRPASDSAAIPATGQPVCTSPAPAMPPMVLLAEDEDLLATAIVGLLEDEGYRLVHAADGDAAVAAFADHENEIALALLDITMPKRDGLQVLQALRQRVPGLPAIVISGNAERRVRDQLAAEPGVCFLAKPFDVDDLLAMMVTALGR